MTVNVSNITPGKAINFCTILMQSMSALRAIDHSSLILSCYFEGEPGVGKSAVAKRIAINLGAKFVDIRANQLSPEVAAGIHTMNYDTNTMIWMPPEWMPAEDGSDGPTVLFFDELASADDRVRKPLFGVFLDRCLNGRSLPDNCYVLAAGNEADTGTMVFELDNATRTRFISYRIIADFTSWMEDYAPEAKITATAIAYLKANVHNFCMTEKAIEHGLAVYGNPRSWHHVSNIERAIMRDKADRVDPDKLETLYHSIAGKVGSELAAEYMGAFENVAQMSNLYDLLRLTPKQRSSMWPQNLGQLYALTYSMMAYPTDIKTARQIIDLSKEMPENHWLPFCDIKAPLLEVIFERLRGLGVKDAEITGNFRNESSEMVDEILAKGPLIRVT